MFLFLSSSLLHSLLDLLFPPTVILVGRVFFFFFDIVVVCFGVFFGVKDLLLCFESW